MANFNGLAGNHVPAYASDELIDELRCQECLQYAHSFQEVTTEQKGIKIHNGWRRNVVDILLAHVTPSEWLNFLLLINNITDWPRLGAGWESIDLSVGPIPFA